MNPQTASNTNFGHSHTLPQLRLPLPRPVGVQEAGHYLEWTLWLQVLTSEQSDTFWSE